MTRAEAAEQLRTLATVAVRNLAVPAVIRPHRDGWLIFMRGGYAWYGTAEAARTRCSPASTAAAYRRTQLTRPQRQKGWSRSSGHGRPPDTRQPLAGPGTKGSPPALAPGGAACRALRASLCRPPCRIHCPVTRHSLR